MPSVILSECCLPLAVFLRGSHLFSSEEQCQAMSSCEVGLLKILQTSALDNSVSVERLPWDEPYWKLFSWSVCYVLDPGFSDVLSLSSFSREAFHQHVLVGSLELWLSTCVCPQHEFLSLKGQIFEVGLVINGVWLGTNCILRSEDGNCSVPLCVLAEGL